MNKQEIDYFSELADKDSWEQEFKKIPTKKLRQIIGFGAGALVGRNLIGKCESEISRRENFSANLNLILTIIAATASVFGVILMLLDN
jgi:hypothetical protein